MSALELTDEERKRAETNCPHCRAKIVTFDKGWHPHYECGTPYMGVQQSSKCKTIQLTRELKETELRQHLINAVNASCSCGGKGRDLGCCQACEVWHRFVKNVEECK